MNKLSKTFLGIVVMVSATLACNFLVPAAPTQAPTPESGAPAMPVATVESPLFEDDFRDHNSGWGVEKSSDATIEYADSGLKMTVLSPEWFAWSPLENQSFSDIHVEVTARKADAWVKSGYSLGLMCDIQGTDHSYYWVAITASSGQYLIGQAMANQDDLILSGNGDWQDSELIRRNAESYRIGVDCGHGVITLYVDGNRIDSVADSAFTGGGVALVVWSGEDSAGPVTFDDFIVTRLK